MNKFLLCGALGGAPCLLLPFAAHAADAGDRLDTVVVVANRQPVPLRQVTADVSVLTSADLEAGGQSTIVDALRNLPAVTVSNSGGFGKASALHVRGEEGFRTQVLIDGIKMADPTGTQVETKLQHILSSGIERVELLRGPQGMMYGADAGGVLNIVTRRAQQPFEADAGAEYGRYDTRTLYGNVRGKADRADYALALADFSSDGFNAQSSDTRLRDDDGYRNGTLHFNGGLQVNDALRLETTVRDTITRSEYDGCYDAFFNRVDKCRADYDQLSYRLAALLDLDSVQQNLSLQRSDIKQRQLTDGVSGGDLNGRIEQAQYQGIWKIPAAGDIVYGADFERQVYKQRDSDEQARNQRGFYLEWQGHVQDRFFYTLGARRDNNDDFGDHTSYRAGAAYLLDFADGDVLKFKSSYGTGFRAPSLYESAYNALYGFGATRYVVLKEETSKGFDAGLEYHGRQGGLLELVYFNQKIEDAIQFDPAAFGSGYLQDFGTSRSEGVELSGEIPIGERISLNGNYTYNDTHDPDGERRIRRPRHVANLGGTFKPVAQLTLALNLRLVRDSEDRIFGVGFQRLDDYDNLEASATWAFNPQWEAYVHGDNLLNDDYQEIIGYNSAGRALYTGLRYHFR